MNLQCFWCGKAARFSRCGSKTVSTALEEEQRSSNGPTLSVVMGAYGCQNCNGLMIAKATIEDTADHGTAFERLEHSTSDSITWYPRQGERRDFPDVPPHIATAASEAYECHSVGANRAALALSRAVVEATAKDKGIKGRLVDMIDEMRDKDFLRPVTCEAAHEVRQWGNGVAHGDFVAEVADDEAEAVLGLMSEVLQEVYQGPAVLAKIRAVRQGRGKSAATN
jgi:hypothetical protein